MALIDCHHVWLDVNKRVLQIGALSPNSCTVSDFSAGMNAAMGVLLHLWRGKIAVLQYVDTSLLCELSLGVYEAAGVFVTEVSERLGQAHLGSAPYQMFQTRTVT